MSNHHGAASDSANSAHGDVEFDVLAVATNPDSDGTRQEPVILVRADALGFRAVDAAIGIVVDAVITSHSSVFQCVGRYSKYHHTKNY